MIILFNFWMSINHVTPKRRGGGGYGFVTISFIFPLNYNWNTWRMCYKEQLLWKYMKIMEKFEEGVKDVCYFSYFSEFTVTWLILSVYASGATPKGHCLVTGLPPGFECCLIQRLLSTLSAVSYFTFKICVNYFNHWLHFSGAKCS